MRSILFSISILILTSSALAFDNLSCKSILETAVRTKSQEVKRAFVFLIKGDSPLELQGTGKQKFEDFLRYYLEISRNFVSQVYGLTKGLVEVADLMKFRPLVANMIPSDHPWVTGINPQTGQTIWRQNILFATENRIENVDDDLMLKKVGTFLTRMVVKSVAPEEIPLGPKRRMPHVVNYIHGTSQYNSAILIFNDFREAIEHFSDPEFRSELKRFSSDQKREFLIYFRQRDYDVQEYALFITYIRAVLPWFSNSDGPQKTVLWGNPAPFAVVNILTGDWSRDIYAMKDPSKASSLARPPIDRRGYFENGPYSGARIGGTRWPERLLTLYSYYRILSRGEKGNHSTLDRRLVDRPGTDNYKIAPIYKEDLEPPKPPKP